MCWGAGILISSGVVRGTLSIQGDLAWRLPFYLQWIWPVPLFIMAYLAPESPWNAVRRGKIAMARNSLKRLSSDTPYKDTAVEATLAYIMHTTALERAETEGASFWECFKGTNRYRTEIVSMLTVVYQKVWLMSVKIELRSLGGANPMRQRNPRLRHCLLASSWMVRGSSIQPQHISFSVLYCRGYHLLVPFPSLGTIDYLYGRFGFYVLLPPGHWRPRLLN